ncbi:MAG: L-aspartate oxidase [Propionibacteriaceae bacterium]|nr:L-aspartate oxidase [Propionibacteriaceae bacterium]
MSAHLTRIELKCPVIIGAGLAGLSAAIELSPAPCVVLSAGVLSMSTSTDWAQGGIAAAVGPDDDPELHAQDTLAAGAGLCEPAAVRAITSAAPAAIDWLASVGARLDRDQNGELALGLEGAHSRWRIVHAMGDKTGAELQRAVAVKAKSLPSVAVWENCWATKILTEDGRAVGLEMDTPGGRVEVGATRIVIATGGLGGLFEHTTNPLSSRGHGLAMAFRAGARLRDVEMVQFHPTALDVGKDPMPLISEAVRGEGALVVDETGKRVIENPLSPRDVVSRAEWAALLDGHKVFLDAREALGKRFKTRFPGIYQICADAGLDPAVDLLPVRPAAHYHMGGVEVDLNGHTTVSGLYAIGETASTGLHGANRLASNSLLEAVVCGRNAGAHLREVASEYEPAPDINFPYQEQDEEAWNRNPTVAKVRGIVSAGAGVLRSRATLENALDELEPYRNTNAGLVATLVCHSALQREESRGGHTRTDFPQTSEVAQHTCVSIADLDGIEQ